MEAEREKKKKNNSHWVDDLDTPGTVLKK